MDAQSTEPDPKQKANEQMIDALRAQLNRTTRSSAEIEHLLEMSQHRSTDLSVALGQAQADLASTGAKADAYAELYQATSRETETLTTENDALRAEIQALKQSNGRLTHILAAVPAKSRDKATRTVDGSPPVE